MTNEHLNTSKQVVRIKTQRGVLVIGPGYRISGLWPLVRREVRTNEQVRAMCGGITRRTLLAWRERGFPAPVLRVHGRGGVIELWARSEVEEWWNALQKANEA